MEVGVHGVNGRNADVLADLQSVRNVQGVVAIQRH